MKKRRELTKPEVLQGQQMATKQSLMNILKGASEGEPMINCDIPEKKLALYVILRALLDICNSGGWRRRDAIAYLKDTGTDVFSCQWIIDHIAPNPDGFKKMLLDFLQTPRPNDGKIIYSMTIGCVGRGLRGKGYKSRPTCAAQS